MRIPSIACACALAAGLGVVAARAATAAPAHQPVCPGNLLANPDFEGGSRKTESEGTSLSSAVADAWVPWFVRGNAQINREPEFKVEQVAIGGDRSRVRSGGQSQKFFTTWGTHTAGMYQRVKVQPGSTVQFTVQGMAYSGEADGFDPGRGSFVSDKVQPGNYKMWAGIDPTGAVPAGMGEPPPQSVVWSEPTMTTDEWVPLSVTVRAPSGVVTVYTKGQPEWPVKHNDSFWEDACLTIAPRGAAITGQAAAAPAAGTSGAGAAAAAGAAGAAVAAASSSGSQAAGQAASTAKTGVAKPPVQSKGTGAASGPKYDPASVRYSGKRPIPR